MNLSRRSLLGGLIAAPAAIETRKIGPYEHPDALDARLLMPVRPWIVPVTFNACPPFGPYRHMLIYGPGIPGRWIDLEAPPPKDLPGDVLTFALGRVELAT
jgi:hypothetical protein